MLDRQLLELEGAHTAFLLCALFALGIAATACLQAYSLSWALSNLWNGLPLADQVCWLALFAGCFVLEAVFAALRKKRMDRLAAEAADGFRNQLLEKLYQDGRPFVQKQGTGSLTALLVEGVDQVETYLANAIARTSALFVVPAVLLAALFLLDWVSGIIALMVFPAVVLQMMLIGHTAGLEAQRQQGEYRRLANHFIDSLRGLETLRAFGRSKDQADQVHRSSERFREATMRTLRIAILSGTVLDAFTTISIAAIAVMLGFRLVDGSLDLFNALMVLVLAPSYFKPIREFAADYHATLNGKTTLSRILSLVGPKAKNEKGCKTTNREPLPGPNNTRLELSVDGLGFSYDKRTVLHNVTFFTRQARFIGIVGPSGCGKSTLAHILAGIAPQSEGTFRVNGAPFPSLTEPTWRNQVAYIPQHPHLFATSLRNNLAFYQPDASDDEIWQAVHMMGLEPLVAALPCGLDEPLGQGGRTVSGGQAQRIALARAFLHRSCRVLVFDEPTAHLDIETELELKERMAALVQGKLVFFATHRLHWLSSFDAVAFIEEGLLRAYGSPDQLLAESEAFRNFVASAEGGSLDA